MSRRTSCYALLLMLVSACKPAEEPTRRGSNQLDGWASETILGPPPGAVRVTERVTSPARVDPRDADGLVDPSAPPVIGAVAARFNDVEDATDSSDASVDAAIDTAAGSTIDVGPAEVEDIAASVLVTRPEDLAPDLVIALSKEATASLRDEARRLNKLGLEAHKKLALDMAKEQYAKALEVFPAFPFARYNLACALALQKQDEAALFHLTVLAYLANERHDNVSRERLDAARIDADFNLLREDLRFRALTGATNVLVSWVADEEGLSRPEAQRLVKALREKRWPAKLAPRSWPTSVPASTIRVVADDPIAEASAKAIAEVLRDASSDASAAAWPIEIGAPLPESSPPIVVIIELGMVPIPTPVAPETPEERETIAAPEPNAATSFATLGDVLGKRLRAQRTTSGGVERHTLELKATGFFVWDLALDNGVKQHRSGRWSGGDKHLSLAFKETTETPDGDGVRSDVKEGLTSELAVELGDGLTLGGLRFR